MNKVAIVSGAASGIGKEVAHNLLLSEFNVYGIDIHPCNDPDIRSFICDISNEDNVKKTYSTIMSVEKNVDVLVNAAGIISVHKCYPASEVPSYEWQRVMNVNLNGTFFMITHLLPYISEGGCIINLSTEQVIRPNIKSAPYAVSKAGIEMLSKIFAIELSQRKIRINTLALGTVQTDFIRHMVSSDQEMIEKIKKADQMMPFGIIKTEDVWNAIRFMIFDAPQLTGQTLLIESGMTL